MGLVRVGIMVMLGLELVSSRFVIILYGLLYVPLYFMYL